MDDRGLQAAQSEIRHAYRSASVGQIYAGLTWVASATAWTIITPTAGILVLLIGGFFIYPITAGVSRLLGNPGVIPSTNPLREAGITIPLVGVLGIPVAGAAALHNIDWFFPAFMIVMGAHYLPFSHLYGMRVFLPLGGAMWLVGLAIGLWAPDLSVIGAWLTGAALVAVGIWAARHYRVEFTYRD
ncbi:MAG: hypothetical protein R3258_09035 [Acidimicrobiia bacterium]|nr:hypothetical protein [Acidimicrobiia bacterium]